MSKISLSSYSAIDKGKKRKYNEDSLLIYEPKHKIIYSKKGYLYVVADGVGGLNKGDIASKTAVETIKEEYYSSKSPGIKNSLIYAIKKANLKIKSLSTEEEKMGTTVVCMVIKDNKAHVANVGDSRAYMLREGKLIKLTEDHSFVGERVKMGELTEEQARVHPRKNIILRCLGDKKDVDIDLSIYDIEEGDKFLLCSDGLWGELPHTELENIIGKDSNKVADLLVSGANQAGGNDNISLILIDIKKLGFVVEEKKVKILTSLTYTLAATSFILICILGFLIFRSVTLSPPVAIINADSRSGNIPLTVNFDASSSYDNGEIVSYEWYIEGEKFEGKTKIYEFMEHKDSIVNLICIDNEGNKGEQSTVIYAHDEELPTAELSIEGKKDEYLIGYDKYLDLNIISDDNFRLRKIILYENNEPIEEFYESDISYKYYIENSGTISFYAEVYDEAGLRNESNRVEITIIEDNIEPTIEYTSLDKVDVLNLANSNSFFPIEIEVSDNKQVEKVELFIDDNPESTLTSEPYIYIWDIDNDGKYKVKIEAYDKAGNKSGRFEKDVIVNLYPQQVVVYSYFFQNSNEIFLRYPDGEVKRLTNNNYDDINPVLSYLREKIIFVSKKYGSYDLYIMSTDGSDLDRLTYIGSQSKLYPIFNHDSTRVLFSNEAGEFNIVDINTKEKTRLE